MDVEATLRIFARGAQLQEIEYCLDVGIETIVSLTCEGDVASSQIGDGLAGITVQLCFGGDPVFGRIFTIVTLIVIRSSDSLVVRRNNARAQERPLTGPMIQLGHGVGLRQILCRITDILNHTKVRLEDGVLGFEISRES